MPGLSVLVPCLNEAAGLPELAARVTAALASEAAEVILIDDGSTDETWATIERLALDHPAIRGLRQGHTQGIAAAWRTGLAHATGDWICVIDADLQYQPEEIPRLLRTMREGGADIVQGVRGRPRRPHDPRFLLSRGLNTVLNLAFGMSSQDNKSGFFLCRRDVLADLLSYRGRYHHWQCFVMVAAHRRGYHIRRIETPFHPRRTGRSAFGRLALRPAFEVALDLITAAREYRAGRS